MDFYPVWPFFACLLLVLGVILLPVFNRIHAPARVADRVETLDGIRGFLALGVFLHHSAIYHGYLADGVWAGPPSSLYQALGDLTVAIFFMITGYLFWRRLLEQRGRPHWLLLYNGRLFRIAPVYLLAVGAMILIVMTKTDWHLNETVGGFIKNCLKWSDLGTGIGSTPDINRFPTTWIVIAGVTWTLHYEWLFYASLLPTSLVARTRVHLPCVAVAFVASVVYAAAFAPHNTDFAPANYVLLFLAGMLTASIQISGAALPARFAWIGSTLVVALGAGIVWVPSLSGGVPALLVLALVFLLIASGADLFGFLTWTPSLRLGDISYDIYLLQGPVMFVALTPGPVRRFMLTSPTAHWFCILLCTILLLVVASLSHLLVERSGIEAGRLLGRRIQAWSQRRA